MNDLTTNFLKEICHSLSCCCYKKLGGNSRIFELFGNKEEINIYVLTSDKGFGWGVNLNQMEKLKKTEKKWFLILLSNNKKYCLSPEFFNDFLCNYAPTNSQGYYKIWRNQAAPYLEQYLFKKITEIIK